MSKELDYICRITDEKLTIWADVYGYAPMAAAIKLDRAMLTWMKSLTHTLRMWEHLAELGELNMTEGEQILAYANLGALVESWLKFFLSVYYLDYKSNPYKKKGKIVEPENLELEELKQFCRGILWTESSKDPMFKWVEKIQQRRNAIHSYKYRELGTTDDFLDDIKQYQVFLKLIINHLPDDPYWED